MVHRFMLFLVVTLAASGPGFAQQFLNTSVANVHALVAARGPAEIIAPTPEYPDPYIDAQAAGYFYLMIMIGCEGMTGCDQIELSASFTTDEPSEPFVNTWNSENRIGTAYIEPGNTEEVFLSYTFVTEPAISLGAFQEVMDIWVETMDAFSNQLYGYDQGSSGAGGTATK
ncbi:MAG: YbjN domain-containing protein [Pseudomonadota bacterium]